MTSTPQAMRVSEAWTLAGPVSFDEIGLERSDDPTALIRAVLVLGGVRDRNRYYALSFRQGPFSPAQYVSTSAAEKYRTTDLSSSTLALFMFAPVRPVPPAPPVFPAALPAAVGAQDWAPSLRDYCQAAGIPTASPLTCTMVLQALVGASNAADAVAQVTRRALQPVLGWDAQLDTSTVMWAGVSGGIAVSAATVLLAVGQPDSITVAGEQLPVTSAELTVDWAGPLRVTVALHAGVTWTSRTTRSSPRRAGPGRSMSTCGRSARRMGSSLGRPSGRC